MTLYERKPMIWTGIKRFFLILAILYAINIAMIIVNAIVFTSS